MEIAGAVGIGEIEIPDEGHVAFGELGEPAADLVETPGGGRDGWMQQTTSISAKPANVAQGKASDPS